MEPWTHNLHDRVSSLQRLFLTCEANDGPNTEEANDTNYQTGRGAADCVQEIALNKEEIELGPCLILDAL